MEEIVIKCEPEEDGEIDQLVERVKPPVAAESASMLRCDPLLQVWVKSESLDSEYQNAAEDSSVGTEDSLELDIAAVDKPKCSQDEKSPHVPNYCGCQYKCHLYAEEFTELKKTLSKYFSSLSYNEQSTFLADQCIELRTPKRRRKIPANRPRRRCTVVYYLPINSEKKRVCQKRLCETLKVTKKRLQTLVNKLRNNEELSDMRGTHKNRPHAINHAVKEQIKRHVASYTKYSQGRGNKFCLFLNLNRKVMYNLFKEQYPESKLSLYSYRKILTEI